MSIFCLFKWKSSALIMFPFVCLSHLDCLQGGLHEQASEITGSSCGRSGLVSHMKTFSIRNAQAGSPWFDRHVKFWWATLCSVPGPCAKLAHMTWDTREHKIKFVVVKAHNVAEWQLNGKYTLISNVHVVLHNHSISYTAKYLIIYIFHIARSSIKNVDTSMYTFIH